MIEISNCPVSRLKRKALIGPIIIDDIIKSISVEYHIEYYALDGEKITRNDSYTKKEVTPDLFKTGFKYTIASNKFKMVDPETGEVLKPIYEGTQEEIDAPGYSPYPLTAVSQYSYYASLGWEYVLSINPDAKSVVLDGNLGVAHSLLLKDDALGLV